MSDSKSPQDEGAGTKGASAAQQKARAMREAAERKRRTRNMAIAGATVLAVLALFIGGFALFRSYQTDQTKVVFPGNVTDNGGFTVGDASAPVTADVYVDYMCAGCAQFETVFDPVFEPLIEDGSLKVQYHPMGNLDSSSRGTKYSSRSANATYCIADSQPEKAKPFFVALFEQQPQQQTTGLSNDQMLQIATDVGVTADISGCVKDKTYFGYIRQQSEESNIFSTPTLLLNGRQVSESIYNEQGQPVPNDYLVPLTPDGVTAEVKKLAGQSSGGAATPEPSQAATDSADAPAQGAEGAEATDAVQTPANTEATGGAQTTHGAEPTSTP